MTDTKFKIGDVVTTVGDTYIGTYCDPSVDMTVYEVSHGFVFAKTPNGIKGGFYASSIQLKKVKTVKDMTDEELALVCREHYPTFYDAYTELVTARKFTWAFDVNTRVITFKKTETVTTTKEL